jgi:hypothetical protein
MLTSSEANSNNNQPASNVKTSGRLNLNFKFRHLNIPLGKWIISSGLFIIDHK